MAVSEITIAGVMGGGAPVYQPAKASQSLTTTTTSAAASLTAANGSYAVEGGDYVRITARGQGQWVAISKAATSAPRHYIPDGGTIDIGPLKTGDTINVADVA